MEELSDLAKEGRDFIFGELGIGMEDFEIPGRISRLCGDERISHFEFREIAGEYNFDITPVAPLSKKGTDDLLHQHGFPTPDRVVTNSSVGIASRYSYNCKEEGGPKYHLVFMHVPGTQ